MEHSRQRTIQRLKELEAPELLINVAKGQEAPGILKSEFQTPYEFYEYSKEFPKRMPFEKNLIPLWETLGECITAYVDQEHPIVIRYYYGYPKTEYKILGNGIFDAIKNFLEFLYLEAGYSEIEIWEAVRECKLATMPNFYNKKNLYRC